MPTLIAWLLIRDPSQSGNGGRETFSASEFLDYQQQNHVFDQVIGTSEEDVLYTTSDGTERFQGGFDTSNTFQLLGVPALLGRGITVEDGRAGAPPVFVMRYKLWLARFNRDPKILNRTFVLNGEPCTLVGIMPPRFAWGDADLWIPVTVTRGAAAPSPGTFHRTYVLHGHLKPGISMRQARADLEVISLRLARTYPDLYPKQFSVQLKTLADELTGQFHSLLLILLGAVSLLLLIACVNVANLLLARATAREKEISIRSALGAGRWTIVRQLLVESLILALGGAVLGCLFAYAGIKGLMAVIPQVNSIPPEAVIRINTAVLLFTLGVAAATALLFGLAPALSAVKRDLNEALRDSGRGVSGGFRHGRLRSALVIAEVALSLALLAGAGLLMRSFFALQQVNLGMDPSNILVVRLPLPRDRYQTAEQVTGFFRPLLARLKALPGVAAVTETSTLPPYGGISSEVAIPGKTHTDRWNTAFQLCGDGYFSTLRIRFLNGRPFTEAEVDSTRKVAVVNQTFVRKYLGSGDSLGQRFELARLQTFPDPVKDPWFEIIGVVGDVKNQGLQEPVTPEVWIPYTLTGSAARGVLIRTVKNPMTLLNAVRREIWSSDRGVALTLTGTLQDFINKYSYAEPRFGLLLLTIFATVGLILVAIGVYSVIAYTISRQTREIGIRMALGATPRDVLSLVIRMGLRLVVFGIAAGLAASLALTRLLDSQLWGVSSSDPLTLGAVVVVLLGAGLAASFFPARRATRVDPAICLRYE